MRWWRAWVRLKWLGAAALASCAVLQGAVPIAHAAGRCSVVAYEFYWRGQVAGFMVNGRFSYDEARVPANGIVREENLLALDVSFYDPQGNLLRTYKDNHRKPLIRFRHARQGTPPRRNVESG